MSNDETCVPYSHRVYVSPVVGLMASIVMYVCEAMYSAVPTRRLS